MYLDSDRRGTAMSPGLALRIAILGGVALVMFAIVFFRLWYLQVLSGDHYLAQANNNRVREVVTPAPRGKIVDRKGHTLVDNRPAQKLYDSYGFEPVGVRRGYYQPSNTDALVMKRSG